MGKITKAVIPVAGLGTRFLPATKAMPKEMLPLIDKPVIQYVVEEAVKSGVPHILMVTGRNKNAVENHFDRAYELESLLDSNGESGKLSKVVHPTELADIHYVRQGDPLGLGHAVSKARAFIANEPFAILLGDEVIDDDGCFLNQMIEIAAEQQSNVVALMEVPSSEVHKYGIAKIGKIMGQGQIQILDFVEKPIQGKEPSNFAVIGRYILQPGVFDVLKRQPPGHGGEIQLTDALATMAKDSSLAGPVVGVIFEGRRFDMGDKMSFIKASVQLAAERQDFGSVFREWLKSYSNTLTD